MTHTIRVTIEIKHHFEKQNYISILVELKITIKKFNILVCYILNISKSTRMFKQTNWQYIYIFLFTVLEKIITKK